MELQDNNGTKQNDYTVHGQVQNMPPPEGQQLLPPSYTTTGNTSHVVIAMPQPIPVTTGALPVVNNYMGLSVFACICCCWPLGLAAIVKAREAENKNLLGDYEGALESARIAKNLAIAAIVFGLILIPVAVVVRIIQAKNAAYNYN